MKLVILFGPHAVGKMTVGQALAEATGLKLFHNHMTIEPVCGLFDSMPKECSRLTNLFRDEIFRAFVKGPEYGMIFTYMWAFDQKSDWDYVESLETLFLSHGAEVCFVELEADFDLRIERNKTENRLYNKPSKRDLAASEARFRSLEEKYRLNSFAGELRRKNYMRIDNTNLSPEEAAAKIRERFGL